LQRLHVVEMKKATTTLSEIQEQLIRVVRVLQVEAGLDIEAHANAFMVDPSTMAEKFFAIGEPMPAPDRGRGQRVLVPVSWIWGPAPMEEQKGAAMIVEQIRAIVGVEEISDPYRDTQIGVVWSVDVTLRVSR
jgi:hypothetical protein